MEESKFLVQGQGQNTTAQP